MPLFSRRRFINNSLWGSLGIGSLSTSLYSCNNTTTTNHNNQATIVPTVISTWKNVKANEDAWAVIQKNGSALDAVEQGVRVPEADPEDQSVGYGGKPDRDGNVTLDACIMNADGDCGSVSFLQNIKHPISVARKVMEDTPHVMLAGEGALKFALEVGFKKENLLTEESKKEWLEWKKTSNYKPVINIEAHDTIGMIAIDKAGNISGACTTSGLGYKMQGRVGDSPVIGAGMYVDNEIGGAAATGMGEAVLKSLGSFLVVELMRQGLSPQKACEEAIMRIVKKQRQHTDIQVGYVAVNKKGEFGAYAIQKGFCYIVYQNKENKLFDATSYL